jgi:hypothetical protein
VESRNPKVPIEGPNDGPIIAPIGEKAIIGIDSRVKILKRRYRSSTIAAPCPACSPRPIAA